MKDLEYLPLEGIDQYGTVNKIKNIFPWKVFIFLHTDYSYGVYRLASSKAKSFIHFLISVLHTDGKSSSYTLCKILLILHYFNFVY